MLRTSSQSSVVGRPQKRVKINEKIHASTQTTKEGTTYVKQQKQQNKIRNNHQYKQDNKHYKFSQDKFNNSQFRYNQHPKHPNPRFQQQTKVQNKSNPKSINKQQVKKKVQVPISKNWKKFIASVPQGSKKQKKEKVIEYVAMDCEFVLSNETHHLGRVSIVNDKGDILLDSFIRPQVRITDYLTEVSSLTFHHIRNSPTLPQILPKLKQLLKNKYLVGHTIAKDIEVCGLSQWKGIRAIIDVAQYFKNGAKLVSLKELTLTHLGQNIQNGAHNSVEDAFATINLFLKFKKEILHHYNIQ